MLTGFVLLITFIFPVIQPVNERIYPTLEACEQMKAQILERLPFAELECAGVKKTIEKRSIFKLAY